MTWTPVGQGPCCCDGDGLCPSLPLEVHQPGLTGRVPASVPLGPVGHPGMLSLPTERFPAWHSSVSRPWPSGFVWPALLPHSAGEGVEGGPVFCLHSILLWGETARLQQAEMDGHPVLDTGTWCQGQTSWWFPLGQIKL